MDEFFALLVAALVAILLFALAVLALVGATVVGVVWLLSTLAAVGYRLICKRKARDSNPEGDVSRPPR